MSLLRSLLYTLVFYLGSVPYVVASFLAIPFGQPTILAPPRAWAWYHYWGMRWVLGIRRR